MLDFLKNTGSWLKDNSDLLSAGGALAGGIGGAYSAYQQGKALDKNYKLNLDLLQEERKRRKTADDNLKTAFANSTYAKEA
ncbi:hypothetical protein CIG2463D_1355 [Campylobacter iguaniorum]|uniref:hypothetical protein n=1 Tax=Campylobacter iguaniorum TaxID=1244531 RepID=UPI00073A4AEA|nr:hypothetical protein [Campylobacter iguaniorum]ALV24923.1 hypothetical protein CIG2463D_1355 [Campylobacter iguaniorum]